MTCTFINMQPQMCRPAFLAFAITSLSSLSFSRCSSLVRFSFSLNNRLSFCSLVSFFALPPFPRLFFFFFFCHMCNVRNIVWDNQTRIMSIDQSNQSQEIYAYYIRLVSSKYETLGFWIGLTSNSVTHKYRTHSFMHAQHIYAGSSVHTLASDEPLEETVCTDPLELRFFFFLSFLPDFFFLPSDFPEPSSSESASAASKICSRIVSSLSEIPSESQTRYSLKACKQEELC